MKNIKTIDILFVMVILFFIYGIADIYKKNNSKNIDLSIDKGINFLYKKQTDDGNFIFLQCKNKNMEKCDRENSLGFMWIIDPLHGIDDERIQTITNRALDFIQDKQLSEGLWQYLIILPPDIDTTSIAANTLKKFGRNISYNQTLIDENKNEAGLYYTWIVGEDKEKTPWEKNDIDCVVNVNVLRNRHTNDRAICEYVNDAIQNKKQCSIYYEYDDKKFSAYYFFSKAYLEGVTCLEESKNAIINYILSEKKPDG